MCDGNVQRACLTLVLVLCSVRNASGLTAADLAHAQGFRECAEILSNTQNFQQNMSQSRNGAFLNGVSQNGGHAHPNIQGRSFLSSVPNRKRSFDCMEENPVKKARHNGRWKQVTMLFFLLFFFQKKRRRMPLFVPHKFA